MTSKEIAESEYVMTYPAEVLITYTERIAELNGERYEKIYSECRPPQTAGINRRLIEAADAAEYIRSLAHDAMHAMWHQDVMKRHKMSQKDFGIPLRRSICSTCSGRGGKRTGIKDVYADPCVGIEEWCDNCCGVGWSLKLVKITEDDV